MNAYVALMFCKQADLRAFGPEVAAAIRQVAGTRFKYAEGAAGVVATGFMTDADWASITKAFAPLWRPEQRCWVLALQGQMLIDKALMDWCRKG